MSAEIRPARSEESAGSDKQETWLQFVNYCELYELLKAYKGLPEQWIQILDSFLKIPHLTCSTSQTSCRTSSTDIDIELQIIV